MEHKEVFIHIGYPKTGTTTLQLHLFPNHSQIDYVRMDGKNFSFISELFYSRENAFKRKLPEIKEELESFKAKGGAKRIVYSEESLTSFSMFFRFNPVPYIYTLDPNSIARKLGTAFIDTQVFNNAKILITIRRQDELIKSMYAQVYNLVFKKFSRTKGFQNFIKYAFIENKNGFILDAINYNDVVLEYEKIFGRENVCVLVFEEFKSEPDNYIKKLSGFMGIDCKEAVSLIGDQHINKRSFSSGYQSDERSLKEWINYYKNKLLGSRSLGIDAQWLHRLLESIYIPGKKLKDIDFDDEQLTFLSGVFSEGNRQLSERHKLKLQKYNYFYKD